MHLPSLLPKEFEYLSDVHDDVALLSALIRKPHDLILFFEHACEDETWCRNHPDFMLGIGKWFTNRFVDGKLSREIVQHVVKLIQQHYSLLKVSFPKNINFSLEDKEYP